MNVFSSFFQSKCILCLRNVSQIEFCGFAEMTGHKLMRFFVMERKFVVAGGKGGKLDDFKRCGEAWKLMEMWNPSKSNGKPSEKVKELNGEPWKKAKIKRGAVGKDQNSDESPERTKNRCGRGVNA